MMHKPVAQDGMRWALLVGVSAYRIENGFQPLPLSGADVGAVKSALSDGQLPFQIRCLTDDGISDPPTLAHLQVALTRLVEVAGSGDLLLFYFSGHGMATPDGTYLMPLDGQRSSPQQTGLSVAWIWQLLAQCRAAVRILILDACHAAPPGDALPLPLEEGISSAYMPPVSGQVLLASSRHQETSAVWQEKGLSAFTWFLTQGLAGAAADERGVVGLSSLYRFVNQGVRRWAFETGRAIQTPVFLARIEGEVVLQKTAQHTNARSEPFTPRTTAPFAMQRLPSTGTIPLPSSSFVGRRQEIAAILSLLRQEPLVTLKGPGGIGKTRLAQQVGKQFQQDASIGVWFFELAPLHSLPEVLQTVGAAFGIQENRQRTVLEQLLAHLKPQRALLILDNCEHLVDSLAEVIQALLHACPQLQLLLTSQERLGLEAEHCFEVPPLTLHVPEAGEDLRGSDAVQLFVARAREAQPGFALDAHAMLQVAELCQYLEGIPLALELAAARLRVLSLEQLIVRLQERLRILRGAEPSGARHSTLRACIDWSYGLLTEPEQALYRRLSVFSGGCALAVVESLCAGGPVHPDDVLDLVVRLVDRSLLQVQYLSPETRYVQLETLREYGRERLREAGETPRLQTVHRDWCLSLAARAEHAWGTREESPTFADIDREKSNLIEAMQTVEHLRQGESLALFFVRLTSYWEVRGHSIEARVWRHKSLQLDAECPQALPDRLVARLYAKAGNVFFLYDNLDEAETLLKRSLKLAQAGGDTRTYAQALCSLGQVRGGQGHIADAVSMLAEGVTMLRGEGNSGTISHALGAYGTWLAHALNFDASLQAFKECAALARESGNMRRLATSLFNLSVALTHANQLEAAAEVFVEAYALRHQAESPPLKLLMERHRARLSFLRGDTSSAATAYRTLIEHYFRTLDMGKVIGLLEETLPLLGRFAGGDAVIRQLAAASQIRASLGMGRSELELVEIRRSLESVGVPEAVQEGALITDGPPMADGPPSPSDAVARLARILGRIEASESPTTADIGLV